MIVTHLELTNFRSYNHVTIDFKEGLHILTGANGVGKTNLVEAIHYLSLARSFRTSDDGLLVKKGADTAAIRATIVTGATTKKVAIGLGAGGKRVLVNDKPAARLSELSALVNVIVFEPRDVLIFDDLPKTRRNFLDIALIKQHGRYLHELTRYEKILRERNELLKQERPDNTLLATLTEQLIAAAEPLVRRRKAYLEGINEIIERIVKAIRGEELGVRLVYEPFVAPDKDFKANAKILYDRLLEADLKRKVTNNGPHREDFHIKLNEHDIADYGSQGENRLLAIALKLSPYFLIEDKDKRPIIVLDDVLSELDQAAQDRLLAFLQRFEQVFITTTKFQKPLGTIYDIQHHGITRRNSHDI